MQRILVPLDGSEFAERALLPARRLAGRLGGELHLVSVVSDIPPIPLASADGDAARRWFEDEEERVGQYLNQKVAELKESGPPPPVHSHVRVGPVSRTVQAVARDIQADLVILTTHGRGTVERAWLGSIADQLLRRLERPLVLLRDEDRARDLFSSAESPRRVLVPLDGSEAAESVLEVVPSLFGTIGTGKVTLVSVVQPPFPVASAYLPHAVSEEALHEEQLERVRTYLEEVRTRLRAGRVDEVEFRVVDARDPAQGILELLEAEAFDLVALSSHGRGGVARFFLGSVADKLVRATDLPVLITRRPEDEPSEA